MNPNFSEFEFAKFFNIFNGNVFNVRFNKAGNISLDVKNLDDFNIDPRLKKYYKSRSYVVYKTRNGFLIRSISRGRYGTDNIFPLNMTAQSRRSERYWWNSKFSYGYSVKWSCFETLDDVIIYFINYLFLYHGIINF